MNTTRGIIGTIVLLIIALIVLGYYNINVQSVFQSPTVENNLLYAWNLLVWSVTHFFWWLVGLMHNVKGFQN
jgi:hypothetical protein